MKVIVHSYKFTRPNTSIDFAQQPNDTSYDNTLAQYSDFFSTKSSISNDGLVLDRSIIWVDSAKFLECYEKLLNTNISHSAHTYHAENKITMEMTISTREV